MKIILTGPYESGADVNYGPPAMFAETGFAAKQLCKNGSLSTKSYFKSLRRSNRPGPNDRATSATWELPLA